MLLPQVWESENENRRMGIREWESENGNWRMGIGEWESKNGNRSGNVRVRKVRVGVCLRMHMGTGLGIRE